MQVRAGLGVDNEPIAAGLDITCRQDIGGQHHQVGFEGFIRVPSSSGNDVRAKGEIRDKLPIHDIPLKEIHASCVKGLDFGA
jgi:hypothetical protein